ncbi:MAG: hypothetical protein HYS27_18815 [Deltaproteobacteria bacterium]|nr:hypothetical protein [Deltaproteobacteria bacterium]
MNRTMMCAALGLTALWCAGCNPAESICQKEYDCQDELGLTLEDDYVDVCAASRAGANNALRQSAEQECEDLANAQLAVATCESALSCEDLAASRAAMLDEADKCKDLRQGAVDAAEAADGGATCDGIGDPPAEGEGEGEGEGE